MRDKIKTICIKNALHMSKLQASLLLVRKFLSNRLKVQFNLNECIVIGPNRKVIAMELCNGSL